MTELQINADLIVSYLLEIDEESTSRIPGVEFKWGQVQYDDDSDKSLHAVLNGKIIGFIDLYPLPTGEYGIGQVTVNPRYRRRGLATSLFFEAKKHLPNLVAHSYDATDAGNKLLAALQRKISHQNKQTESKDDPDGWIGVDFDGTLAKHIPGKYRPTKLGEPVPKMVARVRRWVGHGKKVKIFTARADDELAVNAIKKWLKNNELPDLEITNLKDKDMTEFWDDKAVAVKKNTGEVKESRRFGYQPEPQPRRKRTKEIKGPPPTDPHAHAAYDGGGTLIYAPLDRKKFQSELDKYAPGCGSPIHVAGTNGGSMPCGATLGGRQMFCPYCDPTSVIEQLLKDGDEMIEGIVLTESPEIKTLKKNARQLDPEERAQVMKAKAVWHHGPNGEATPAVRKAVVNGKTWYWCATHRFGQVRSTLAAAIKAFPAVKETS